jgi:hypothetical protein
MTTIRGDRAETQRSDEGYRILGWLLMIGGMIWMAWNLTAARATPSSWRIEQVALPFVVIGTAVFALRASANEHIQLHRAALTVRRSSQFRSRVQDLSGVKRLFIDFPSLRDWTHRFWQPVVSKPTVWSDWNDILEPDDLLLLITVTEVFDDVLLTWWLDGTP